MSLLNNFEFNLDYLNVMSFQLEANVMQTFAKQEPGFSIDDKKMTFMHAKKRMLLVSPKYPALFITP